MPQKKNVSSPKTVFTIYWLITLDNDFIYYLTNNESNMGKCLQQLVGIVIFHA